MLRHIGTITLTAVSIAASAEEGVDGPYYRFQTELEDVIQNPDGSMSSLVLEYFAGINGDLQGVRFGSEQMMSLPDTTLQGELGVPRCVPICWPDPTTTTGKRCIGCYGPNSDFVFVSIAPKSSSNGIDFEVGIQQPMIDDLIIQELPGFSVNEDGSVVPRIAE